MKKIRKLLLLVLCAAFVAVSALFAVACGDTTDGGDNGNDTPGNEQDETTYTVTYALGEHAAADATIPAAATANKDNAYKVTLPAAPNAAEGWKFAGWKVGSDVKAAGTEITVSANMTVTATWEEDSSQGGEVVTSYTVTYALGDHAAENETVPAAATANKDNNYKVTLPAAPAAAEGWLFSGWKVGNDVKAAGTEITVSANMTVTAAWEEVPAPAATYTVTYALGDHAAEGATVPAAATATKDNGYKVTLPAAPAAAEGWLFSGWKVGNDVKAAGTEITVSANMTVTAAWEEVPAPAATYTVTYALGEHAAEDATVPAAATATKDNGYKVTLPAAPNAAEGWEFAGWKVGEEVKEAGAEITVSADLTVTATWTEVSAPDTTYTVTYALGEHAAENETVPAAATANKDNNYKVTLPAAPNAAAGWKFAGWKVGDDTEVKEAGTELTVSADVTVTAQWTEVSAPAATYTVTYALGDHAAENETVPAAATATKDNDYKVTLPAAPKAADEWKFTGWKVGDDTELKAAGAELTVSANVTVTAQWAVVLPDGYNGTWQQSSGDTVGSGDLVIGENGVTFQEKAVTVLPATSGYTFTYTDDDGSSMNYSIDLPADLGDKVLVLSHVEDEENVVVYFLKSNDTYPTVSFGAELVGEWITTDATAPSVAIRADGLNVGPATAIVLVSNADSNVYMVYATGSVYKLTYADGSLKLLAYGEEETTAVTYTKYVAKGAELPDDFHGTWSNGTHTVVISDDGTFTYDDTEYPVYVEDESMKQYYFTDSNAKKWVFYMTDDGIYFQQGYDNYFTLKFQVQRGVLPVEFDGVWKNSDHTVEITDGNLVVDHDPYTPTDAGEGKYSFEIMGMPYEIFLRDGDLVLACVEPGMGFESVLSKVGGSETVWNWGVVFETTYAGVYSDGEHTLVIYQDGKVAFDDHKAKVLSIGFSTYDISEYDYAQFDLDNGAHWQFYGISDVWKDNDKKIPLINGDGDSLTLPYTGPAPSTWGEEVGGEDTNTDRWYYFVGGEQWDDNDVESLPTGDYATEADGYAVVLPDGPTAKYGYTFVGWQDDLTQEVYPAGETVTITADQYSFTALYDDYFEESKNVVLGNWGQVLPQNYTLQKGEKLVLTGSFSGKGADNGAAGIVTQVFANGTTGDKFYFFRPDCPANVVGPTFPADWKFWDTDTLGWDIESGGFVEATYKTVTGGDVTITVELDADGILHVTVMFSGDEASEFYTYTNEYYTKVAMDSALVFFAQDGCTADPVNVKHYKTPDLFTAEQQGTYKSADNKVTVTVTGTTVTLAVEGKEAVTTNAKDILVGAGGQYGIYTYTSATQPNQEPTVNLEFTDEGVLLVYDFAEYLGAKEVKITKQV